ncbi:helix-turn-helix domain-containing protein [Nocardioides terrisoli]|uniref:helix-turn-helix domain-containing protein n=1 Tax=Nocardioides terrisoli TaxID=3388267 RepID=UPI00287B77D2|nr:helix-turn-helix transcriptional regulator [Nocardioides marmorisolisilvae]
MVAESVLLRESLGTVLRAERMRRGMTLRELSGAARISLGYISEVERGQKEASSELLAALCDALGVPLSTVLRLTSDEVAVIESPVPDTVPAVRSDVRSDAAVVLSGVVASAA